MIILLSTGTWGVILGVASIIIAILIYFLQKIIRYPGQLKFALVETWKVMSVIETKELRKIMKVNNNK